MASVVWTFGVLRIRGGWHLGGPRAGDVRLHRRAGADLEKAVSFVEVCPVCFSYARIEEFSLAQVLAFFQARKLCVLAVLFYRRGHRE